MIFSVIENIFIFENYTKSIIALMDVIVKSYFERDICHKIEDSASDWEKIPNRAVPKATLNAKLSDRSIKHQYLPVVTRIMAGISIVVVRLSQSFGGAAQIIDGYHFKESIPEHARRLRDSIRLVTNMRSAF
jgi:hypothetical protein